MFSRLCNDLPSDIRHNPSINILKQKHFTCKSLVFLRWPTISNITQSSSSERSLNNHLFLTNFVDSPNCVCCESRSNHHYLCPLYNHIRLTLFVRLHQLPSSVCLQTLLFIDDSQSLSDNKRVFEAVQSFIIASKRFN